MSGIVSVIFIHDDSIGKWSIFVNGTDHATEAMQAFNAVVLTCRDTNVQVGLKHRVTDHGENAFEISPEVTDIGKWIRGEHGV